MIPTLRLVVCSKLLTGATFTSAISLACFRACEFRDRFNRPAAVLSQRLECKREHEPKNEKDDQGRG
jgi:hypothetical protein